jgi:hypothetical protein
MRSTSATLALPYIFDNGSLHGRILDVGRFDTSAEAPAREQFLPADLKCERPLQGFRSVPEHQRYAGSRQATYAQRCFFAS